MYHPPPCRGRSLLDGKKVLLIDEKQTTRDTRANVLRSHGVEVDAADSLQRARVLWRPRRYDLILLDVRRQFPGEALQFYEQISMPVRDSASRFWSGRQSIFHASGPMKSWSNLLRADSGARR